MTASDPKETFDSLRKIVEQVDNFVADQLVELDRFRVIHPLRFFAICVVTLSLLFGMMHLFPPTPSNPVFDSVGEFVLVISFFFCCDALHDAPHDLADGVRYGARPQWVAPEVTASSGRLEPHI